MNKTVSVPRRAFVWLLCLIVAMALLLGACQDTAENESGTITIAIGVSPTARWSGDKPTEDFLKNNVTHVIELFNGGGYGTKIRTITLTPGNTSHTETNVPLGALRVEIRASLNGYDFAYGDTEITVASGKNSAPVTMQRLEHGIVLSEKSGSTYTFPALTQGYGSGDLAGVEVLISNYAASGTGALTISLSGTGNGSFNLTGAPIFNISQDNSATFSVRPAPGLALGTYTATVNVTGDNDIDASFAVSVMVVPEAFDVYDTATWNTACTAISTGGNDMSYTINLTGDFSVAGTTANTFGAVTGLNVTITGNHTISLSSNGSLLRIGANQTVTLKDAHLAGLLANNNSLVYVNGGTLNMEGGTISDNKASSGGGVFVASGSFIMSGGTISGNKGSWGGGVNNSGTFTMTSGTISGNTADSIGGGGGGGVVSYGTFNMSGGTISGNTDTGNSGGGVFVSGSDTTFTMTGGRILGNNAANNGGGVFISAALNKTGTFNMEGGEISGNTANNGGGVYVGGGDPGINWHSGLFNMTGGEISGNTANNQGGGVYITAGSGSNATFDLKSLDLVEANIANAATNPGKKVYVNGGTFKVNGNAPDPALKDGINYYWP